MVGIAPIVIGWAMYMTTVLYESFRFMDCYSAMFTMFYTIQGDTVFDVYFGIVQINFIQSVIWGWLWLYFGTFVINKIALAMVEEGYLTNKYRLQFDWLTKKTRDPGILTDEEKFS